MNRMMRTVRGGLAALVVAGLVQSVGSLALVTSADAAGTAMRATTAVNVRSGAGTNYSRIGLLQAGEQIQALSSKNGWTQVNYKGRTGYVASAYLASSSGGEGGGSSSGASGVAYTTTALNLRTGPSLRSSVKTVASKGTKVTLTGTVRGEFSQVTWNGQTLWAATRYLSQSAGAASQDLPSTTKKLRATTALMIRTSPERDYRSLGDVPRGTILDCTDVVTSGMAQCIWQGNVRWFNNQYLRSAGSSSSPTPGNLPSTTVQYATANLNIWNSATGSAHTGEIPKGSEVAVTGTVQSGAPRSSTTARSAGSPPVTSAPPLLGATTEAAAMAAASTGAGRRAWTRPTPTSSASSATSGATCRRSRPCTASGRTPSRTTRRAGPWTS